MVAFTIRDMEHLSGIKAHTVRVWEQRYGFLKPKRTNTNIRYYSSGELKSLLHIALLNKYGYKISHIVRMSGEEISDRVQALNQADARQERLLNDLVLLMMEMDMPAFEAILDQYTLSHGIDKTIQHLIYPFLEKTGILWHQSPAYPANEYLVKQIIRNKLIHGIENAFSPVIIPASVLLFLPEGEHHETGLLYMHYLMKSHGVKTIIYLGANIPLKDLENVANLKQPDFLYAHLSALSRSFNFDNFLSQFANRCRGYQLLISGSISGQYKKTIPSNIHLFKTLPRVLEKITAVN